MNTGTTISLAARSSDCTAKARPTPVASTPTQWGTKNRGYHRTYTVHATGGLCQLQRVRVHIQYHAGRALLADYRQTYFEFFQFDNEQASVVDTHDFDLARDGWRQSVIIGLLKKHRIADSATGEPRLTVKKQFVIAPGLVHAASPHRIHEGAYFGILASGSNTPSNTRLHIACGDGSWHTIDTLPACQASYPIAGSGSFASAQGYRTFEHFRYYFAALTGTLHDRGHYHPHRIL